MVVMYRTILDYGNETGVMPLLYSIRDGIPFSFPGILISVFFIVFAGSLFVGKFRTGRSKIIISLFIGSVSTLIMSMFLALAQLITWVVLLFWAFMVIVFYILMDVSNRI